MRAWARLPLRTQLPLLTVVVLLVGLTLTGATALTFLRQSLVNQLDDQLARASQGIVDEVTNGLPSSPGTSSTLPSDYQVLLMTPSGQVVGRWAAGVQQVRAAIPAMTSTEVDERAGRGFTVGSVVGGEDTWRVLARPLVAAGTGEPLGSVAVALPMGAAEETLEQMGRALLLIGVGVVALGAAAGLWGVRRSLRPLRQIEDTAAAIAAGDMSRRVPEAPTSTEVGRLGGALNEMLAQIEQAFAARAASQERMRRFVADASHELRTPLATIRGYGELYRMGAVEGPEATADTLRRIEESAARMGVLVQDLLSLARLDEDRPMGSAPVDLAVLAADGLADLRALDPARTARLVPLAEGGTTAGAVVLGDEGRLRQVVANLVGNVVQHTPAGTPVEVAVGAAADGTVALEVRDHGPGIPPEHADRVFERFYRVDASRGRASGGAGLGMAIVAAIVEAHGGTVGLSTTPGGGATVTVRLPAAPPGSGV